jgi:hypothetical protein
MAKTKLTTIATFTSDTPIGSVIPTKPNKAALIRELLKQKKKAKEIAAEVGCLVQYVYSVQNADRVRARKAKARRDYERRKEIVAGSVKRKYVKSGKYAKKATPEVRTQYIEVEVPQPFSHFTFWQRLRILFLGRAA